MYISAHDVKKGAGEISTFHGQLVEEYMRTLEEWNPYWNCIPVSTELLCFSCKPSLEHYPSEFACTSWRNLEVPLTVHIFKLWLPGCQGHFNTQISICKNYNPLTHLYLYKNKPLIERQYLKIMHLLTCHIKPI